MSKSLLVSSETSPSTCSAGEEVEITYSYWDGSGHRRHVKVRAAQLCDGSEPGNGTNSLPVCSTPSSFIINIFRCRRATRFTSSYNAVWRICARNSLSWGLLGTTCDLSSDLSPCMFVWSVQQGDQCRQSNVHQRRPHHPTSKRTIVTSTFLFWEQENSYKHTWPSWKTTNSHNSIWQPHMVTWLSHDCHLIVTWCPTTAT